MIKLYKNIALILLFITLFSGCQIHSKPKFTVINEGKIPKVAIIISTAEETIIEYFGHTIFNNARYEHPSEDMDDIIKQVVKSTLNADRVIDYSFPDASKTATLEKKISKPLKEFWYVGFNDKELPLVSEWAKSLNVDYVAFILPGSSRNRYINLPEMAHGKGLLVDNRGICFTYLFASHDIHLVDVATSKVLDVASITTYKQIKNFNRKLSDKEYKKIKSEYEEKEATNNSHLLFEPLESKLAYTRLYKAKDFKTISDQQVESINQQLLPIVQRNIEQNLLKLGFTRQTPKLGWIDQIPATDQNIKHLSTRYIRK